MRICIVPRGPETFSANGKKRLPTPVGIPPRVTERDQRCLQHALVLCPPTRARAEQDETWSLIEEHPISANLMEAGGYRRQLCYNVGADVCFSSSLGGLEMNANRFTSAGAEGTRIRPSPIAGQWYPGNPDRLAAVCVRSCIDYLEREGNLTRTFHNPFRKRPAWTRT